ncbi:phytoene/squalene synthase family protein [Salipaludibacillus sp. CUR1]|uniref:phytoene/squalene synthase family protein n=1 Tax=Salipaludibacillus sp. CUR1 TaxID=2820003 RepID=UPI001E53A76F|nr:phytoene/squalene synthase family protein [Salipaludibacillus sp. CUR1]MCE7794397.1 phytoene/squalene synthase family protein [Salipaludibacillus sp. CUR1]
MHVNEAYQSCKKIIDYHSKTFAKAFQHLPLKKRRAVWAVYAFCRTADDIVDEGLTPDKDIREFKRQLDLFSAGQLPEPSPLWIALKDTFQRFDFDLTPFYEMIAGQEMDLKRKKYTSLDDVLDYSYHVASTVGLMLLPILAPANKDKLTESAIYLGYAMQLTNILRDIGEDLGRGRVYIPEELMVKHGYTLSMLEENDINLPFKALWEEMACLAEKYYELSLESIHLYPAASRMPVKAAAHFYREILNSVRSNGYDVFGQRAFVTSEEKKQILSTIAE